MNPEVNWHSRFRQQAGWTRELRNYLFQKAGLKPGSRILEVGCGTGAILGDIRNSADLQIHGLDIAPEMLKQAAINAPSAQLTMGDAHTLPFSNGIFEITFCHYLLLWVSSPLAVLREMKRVTRKGGVVMAMAEPDYTARIDEPKFLEELGTLQTESLVEQGADTQMGIKLGNLFQEAGIDLVEFGWMQDEARAALHSRLKQLEYDQEWEVLESDLQNRLTSTQLEKYHQDYQGACRDGSIRIHIPTAFAWGTV